MGKRLKAKERKHPAAPAKMEGLQSMRMKAKERKHPAAPAKMEGLQSMYPPPFLNKLYDMVNDNSTDSLLSWSTEGESFIVWKPSEFANDLLPNYFKHNNFESFRRQLSYYGFGKVDPDRWEFANKAFVRGQRHLLKDIERRKRVSYHQWLQQQPQSSTLGLKGDVKRLKKDKNVSMLNLVRERQQQPATEQELQVIWQRLQVTQQQMMSLLSRALDDPTFVAQRVQRAEENDLSNRYSGVALVTDMQVCAPEPTSMPMGETPTELQFRHPSSLAEAARRFEGHSVRPLRDSILSELSTAEPTRDVYVPVPGHSGDSEGFSFGKIDPSLEFPESSAPISSGMKDIFSEHFLTANPVSPGKSSEEAETVESAERKGGTENKLVEQQAQV